MSHGSGGGSVLRLQSEAQELTTVKMSKFGGGIGAPTTEERLKEAAEIHLRLGQIQRYCELMVELGEVRGPQSEMCEFNCAVGLGWLGAVKLTFLRIPLVLSPPGVCHHRGSWARGPAGHAFPTPGPSQKPWVGAQALEFFKIYFY